MLNCSSLYSRKLRFWEPSLVQFPVWHLWYPHEMGALLLWAVLMCLWVPFEESLIKMLFRDNPQLFCLALHHSLIYLLCFTYIKEQMTANLSSTF